MAVNPTWDTRVDTDRLYREEIIIVGTTQVYRTDSAIYLGKYRPPCLNRAGVSFLLDWKRMWQTNDVLRGMQAHVRSPSHVQAVCGGQGFLLSDPYNKPVFTSTGYR